MAGLLLGSIRISYPTNSSILLCAQTPKGGGNQWNVYSFLSSSTTFTPVDLPTVSYSSSIENSTPRRIIRDISTNTIYCVGGVNSAPVSFITGTNCWTVRTCRLPDNSGTLISTVPSGNFSYMVSRPGHFYENSDTTLAYGCAIKNGKLYVAGIISGNLATGVSSSYNNKDSAVIYSYEYDPLNNTKIHLSCSRGIRTIYELYPAFFDANNVPLEFSNSYSNVNGICSFKNSLLTRNF